MSIDHHADPAIKRLTEHLASLRSDPPLPMHDIQRRLNKVMGMIPMFPGQFVYVVNYTSGAVVYAKGFERVLGYPDDQVDLPLIIGCWHPDDAPIMAHITEVVTRNMMKIQPPIKPFEATLLVDYRMRKANGSYIKVLRHTSVFEVNETNHKAFSTFSMCQDISTITSSNAIGWQVAGDGMEKLDLHELRREPRLQYRPSAREMDILRKLAEGKSSKQIAAELGISDLTVSTHRRNLLVRTGLKNTAELISMMKDHGWS